MARKVVQQCLKYILNGQEADLSNLLVANPSLVNHVHLGHSFLHHIAKQYSHNLITMDNLEEEINQLIYKGHIFDNPILLDKLGMKRKCKETLVNLEKSAQVLINYGAQPSNNTSNTGKKPSELVDEETPLYKLLLQAELKALATGEQTSQYKIPARLPTLGSPQPFSHKRHSSCGTFHTLQGRKLSIGEGSCSYRAPSPILGNS